MSRSGIPVFAIFCAIASLVSAQGRFLQPTGSDGAVIFSIGDTIDISWSGVSSYPIFSLGVFSSSNKTISWLISDSKAKPSSFRWTVDPAKLGFDLSGSRLYQFYACNGTYADNTGFTLPFKSPVFSIKDANSSASVTSTSTSASTSTVPTTISTSAVSSTLQSSTATSTPILSSNSSTETSALSTGAKAGIAIAAVLGVLAALAIGFFFYRRRSRYRAQQQQQQYPASEHGLPGGMPIHSEKNVNDYYSASSKDRKSRHQGPIVQEMHGDSALRAQLPTPEHYPIELPGNSPRMR